MSDDLTPAAFHILLALADRDRHGYSILQDVEERTEGALRLSPGTLYSNLKRMRAAGWIVELGSALDTTGPGARRRTYRLTDEGRSAAEAELARLESLVGQARDFGLRPRTS